MGFFVYMKNHYILYFIEEIKIYIVDALLRKKHKRYQSTIWTVLITFLPYNYILMGKLPLLERKSRGAQYDQYDANIVLHRILFMTFINGDSQDSLQPVVTTTHNCLKAAQISDKCPGLVQPTDYNSKDYPISLFHAHKFSQSLIIHPMQNTT